MGWGGGSYYVSDLELGEEELSQVEAGLQCIFSLERDLPFLQSGTRHSSADLNGKIYDTWLSFLLLLLWRCLAEHSEGHPVCAPTPVHVQVQVHCIG